MKGGLSGVDGCAMPLGFLLEILYVPKCSVKRRDQSGGVFLFSAARFFSPAR